MSAQFKPYSGLEAVSGNSSYTMTMDTSSCPVIYSHFTCSCAVLHFCHDLTFIIFYMNFHFEKIEMWSLLLFACTFWYQTALHSLTLEQVIQLNSKLQKIFLLQRVPQYVNNIKPQHWDSCWTIKLHSYLYQNETDCNIIAILYSSYISRHT